MNTVCRFIRQLVMLFVVTLSASSYGGMDAPPVQGPRWACWYSPSSLSVQCLLSQVPTVGLELRAAEVAATISDRLPILVRTILGSPEQLAGSRISIPMMTVPYEMDFVRLLAKSVMCGVRPDCSISFDANRDGLAEVRAVALESGASESEVMAEIIAQGLVLAQEEKVAAPVGKRKRGFAARQAESGQVPAATMALADIR
jgi:hypothetical protein